MAAIGERPVGAGVNKSSGIPAVDDDLEGFRIAMIGDSTMMVKKRGKIAKVEETGASCNRSTLVMQNPPEFQLR